MKKNKGFQFKPFFDQQIKLLTWWLPGVSPYADYDGIIAEGSIRAGKTMGALKRNVLNPMFQILVAKGIQYKYILSDDPRIEIGNNVYYIFGGDNEKSQDKVQGLTTAGAYLDEAAPMPKSFVNQVMGRCSVDGAKYFFNCNPGHPKHWLKVEIIDHAKEKNFLVLHFTMDDNLTLSEKVKERLKRMFSGIFYLCYILGQWVVAEGLVYDMFSEDKHRKKVTRQPKRICRWMKTTMQWTKSTMPFIRTSAREGVMLASVTQEVNQCNHQLLPLKHDIIKMPA
jgi:PBSX family phage terminase large subunit